MEDAILSVFISGSLLVALAILFQFERHRGKRFFEGVRTIFDEAVLRVFLFFRGIARLIERTALRQTLHYFFHKLLEAFLFLLKSMESAIATLLKSNRAAAKKIARERTKLDELGDHKEASALTERERRAHKEHSIGMRL